MTEALVCAIVFTLLTGVLVWAAQQKDLATEWRWVAAAVAVACAAIAWRCIAEWWSTASQ